MAKSAPKPKRVPAPARVAAFQSGLDAESRAVGLLAAQGFTIAAQRYKTRVGEIDIVAARDGLVVFVEVKARATLDDAAYAVTPRQQSRIVRAALTWLAAHPHHGDCDLRFDAILVARDGTARHLIAAFDATSFEGQ